MQKPFLNIRLTFRFIPSSTSATACFIIHLSIYLPFTKRTIQYFFQSWRCNAIRCDPKPLDVNATKQVQRRRRLYLKIIIIIASSPGRQLDSSTARQLAYGSILYLNLIPIAASSTSKYFNTPGTATTVVSSPPTHRWPSPSSHMSPATIECPVSRT